MPFEYIEQYYGMGFRVGYVSSAQYPPHYHNEFELLYSLRGTANISIQNDMISLNEGECVIVNRNMIHMYSTQEIEAADIVYLNISPAFCQAYCPQFGEYEITQPLITARDYPEFIQTFRAFVRVYFSEAFHPQRNTRFKLMSLLTKICRHMMNELPNHKSKKSGSQNKNLKQERLVEILDYISKRHTQNITLSEVAKHFDLSIYYLSHFIRENLGVSFQKYLTRLRIDSAVWMIICDPDMNLIDICRNAGFSAPRYFRAAFIDCLRCTPSEYRERYIKSCTDTIDTLSLKSEGNYAFSFPFIGRYDSLIPFINIHGHARSCAYILDLLDSTEPERLSGITGQDRLTGRG